MKSVTKWSAHKNSPCHDIPLHFICFEKKAQIVFVVVVVGHYSERDQSWFLIAFYFILLERRWYIKVRGWWVVAVHTLVLLLRLLITIIWCDDIILQCALFKVLQKSVFVPKYAFKLFQLAIIDYVFVLVFLKKELLKIIFQVIVIVISCVQVQ